jgi:hypothetical protein
MGAIEARTHTDSSRAVADFLAYAAEKPENATDKDFNQIGGRLGEAGRLEEGIEVLSAGLRAYPDSPHLKVLLNRLGDLARTSGSATALEELKGLGYVGGD